MYILHLTDLHCDDDFTLDQQEGLIKVLKEFINSKGREFYDLICLTGDMSNLNANDSTHTVAIKFIKDLKKEMYDKDHSFLFSCPGNHDIITKEAVKIAVDDRREIFRISDYDEARKIPVERRHRAYDTVDLNCGELAKCFVNYQNFVDEIEADNNTSQLGTENNQLFGYTIIPTPHESNKEILVSWFNTSWLCLSRSKWQSILNPAIEKRYFSDEGMLSAGKTINGEAFQRFDPDKYLFSLAMCHHYPRTMNWFDVYSFRQTNGDLEPSFYRKISQYSLVLNGHTHGELYDRPFCTNPSIDGNDLDPTIAVYEVHFNSNFIVRYKIPVFEIMNQTRKVLGKPEDHPTRVDTFDPESFLREIKATYGYDGLLKDLKWHKDCLTSDEVPEQQDLIKNNNYMFETDYQRRIKIKEAPA